jgi:thiamine transport system ATP-binding protein
MLQLVREVADETGALVLMVTHDPQDALALAGDTAFVAGGIVHPPVATAELFANPPPTVQDYLGRK